MNYRAPQKAGVSTIGGRSNKATARTLGLSVKTIEKHRANLMRKLGLRNSAEVTMFAIKHGLVSGEGFESAT
jgi:DNA-binding NarL/FixJ family response regulator